MDMSAEKENPQGEPKQPKPAAERTTEPAADPTAGRSRPAPGFAARIPWKTVIAVFLATRLALFLVAAVTVSRVPPSVDMQNNFVCPGVHAVLESESAPGEEPPLGFRAKLYADAFSRWDSEWYLLIAREGYDCAGVFAGNPRYEPDAAAGFFPLYPILVRAVAQVTGNWVAAGVIVSNMFFLGALLLLAALVMIDHSRRAAILTVLFIALFPGGIFFGAVYAESVFLFLAVALFYCARRKWWWAILPLGFLAALSRPMGAVLLLPIGYEVIRHHRKNPAAALLWLAGFPAGIAAFALHCHAVFGNALAFAARQSDWRGTLSGPWKAFARFFEDPAFHGSHNSLIDLGVAVLALIAVACTFKILRFSYALTALLMVALPLCTTLWSFTRLAAPAFPLFLCLALLTEKRPKIGIVYVAIAPLLAGLLMALFASWHWAN
jgi:hypothetical protein